MASVYASMEDAFQSYVHGDAVQGYLVNYQQKVTTLSELKETDQALSQALGGIPCPVFLAPGNHDFYGPRSLYAALDWPENVHIFTSGEVRRVEIPGLDCVVYGRAFLGPREDRSPLEHETLHWTRAQGERLTHVFEVSHWDWPESRETNDRTLDFFRRACAAPEQAAEE